MTYRNPVEQARALHEANARRRQADANPLRDFLGPDTSEIAQRTREQRAALQDALQQSADRQTAERQAAEQERAGRDLDIILAFMRNRFAGSDEEFQQQAPTLLAQLNADIVSGRVSLSSIKAEMIGGSLPPLSL
jgi:hypothetical protein